MEYSSLYIALTNTSRSLYIVPTRKAKFLLRRLLQGRPGMQDEIGTRKKPKEKPEGNLNPISPKYSVL